MRSYLGLLLLLLWAPVVLAQAQFTATLSTYSCRVGDQVVLELRLDGPVQDPSEPVVPPVEGMEITSAGVSKSLSSINGVTTSSSSYTYIVVPRRAGNLTIPAIAITAEGTTYTTRPMQLQVSPSQRRPSTPPLFPPPLPWGGPPQAPGFSSIDSSPEVLVECEVSTERPYVNQLVIYTFRFLHRVQLRGNPNYEPPAATGFLREDLGQSTLMLQRNGVDYSASEVKTAFFATSPGELTIGPTRLTCYVVPDPFSRSYMFQDPVRELVSEPLTLQVRPVPMQGRPPSFQGAVGTQVQMQASLSKSALQTGESARLRITLSGDSHPDLMMDPALPGWPGLRLHNPESKAPIVLKSPFRSTRVLNYPVIPQKAGRYKLQPISFSYFNPHTEKFRTLNATPLELAVQGNPLAEASPGPEEASQSDPLGPPALDRDLRAPWALGSGVLLAAALPWALSALALGIASAYRNYQLHLQTRPSRLRRCLRQIHQARTLDRLAHLVYEGLEILHQRSFKALPLHHLRDSLPADLVEQLEQVETLRYAPEAKVEASTLEALRKIVVRELEGGLQ